MAPSKARQPKLDRSSPSDTSMADRIIDGGKTGTVEGVNNDVTIYPFDPFPLFLIPMAWKIVCAGDTCLANQYATGFTGYSRRLCKPQNLVDSCPGPLTCVSQDSDTNPNTTASSIAGDASRVDGRRRRSEATMLRKSVFGKKHNRLDLSKVLYPAKLPL